MIPLTQVNLDIEQARVCVVIPCYNVGVRVFPVLESMPSYVDQIIVVDDQCPEQTGLKVQEHCDDPRVSVLFQPENTGVGGAVLAGFEKGLKQNADILIKLDGDGQMDSTLIERFVNPILSGMADYTKGNRFYFLESSSNMPLARRIGNLGLTFISRLSTGYYSVSDPTNGFLAIDARLARELPISKISKRYFFETDLLFRLNTLRARVLDIPHSAFYADEVSGLDAKSEVWRFSGLHFKVMAKRLFYNYILRDFSMGSIFLLLALVFGLIGVFGGINAYFASQLSGMARSGGEIAILEVSIILATLFGVGFFNHDINQEPKTAISPLLSVRPGMPLRQFDSEP